MTDVRAVLESASFGRRTAEEERDHLRKYFVETNQWKQVIQGDVDVIYGAKGAGKSAIYSLIEQSVDDLASRGITTIAGENPQGAPAFKD